MHKTGIQPAPVMPDHGLELLHRPDLPALIARWEHDTTAHEVRLGYETLRALADEVSCHRWLLDLRRRADITEPAVNLWFGHEFAPSLRGRYGAPVRLAFLVSPLRASEPVSAQVSSLTSDCLVATFTDEAAAHAWLEE